MVYLFSELLQGENASAAACHTLSLEEGCQACCQLLKRKLGTAHGWMPGWGRAKESPCVPGHAACHPGSGHSPIFPPASTRPSLPLPFHLLVGRLGVERRVLPPSQSMQGVGEGGRREEKRHGIGSPSASPAFRPPPASLSHWPVPGRPSWRRPKNCLPPAWEQYPAPAPFSLTLLVMRYDDGDEKAQGTVYHKLLEMRRRYCHATWREREGLGKDMEEMLLKVRSFYYRREVGKAGRQQPGRHGARCESQSPVTPAPPPASKPFPHPLHPAPVHPSIHLQGPSHAMRRRARRRSIFHMHFHASA